jgi:hypothetical protein
MSNTALKILPNDDPDAVAGDGGLDTAAPVIYFDQGAKKFWWRSARGEWVGRDKELAKSYLKQFCSVSGAASKDEKISQLDRELLRVTNEDYVSYAGPLAGWREGFFVEAGQRILVTRSPALIDPVHGEWPTLDRMFSALLAGSEAPESEEAAIIDQRPSFFAWWRYSLQCLRECYPERGLCMVLAGDAGCGKTLIKEMVRLSFGGREVYPYSYMIGRDNFNAEMLEAELWTVDDETADTKMTARIEFGAEIKKAVANSAMRFRGMMREAVTLTTFKRLFICVNREPDRLMVLPPMDDDIKGKVALLMAYNSKMFEEVANHSTAEKKEFWAKLNEELPHFLHWLLYEFEAGEELNGRFGSPAYHHPEIGRELFTLSPEMILMDQIDRVLASYFSSPLNDFWEGSSAALRNLLVAEDSPLSSSECKNVPPPNWLGKNVRKLSERFPSRFIMHRTGTQNLWRLFPPREGTDYTGGGES